MNHVERLIVRFGGLSAMARALGHKHPSRIQGWRQRGAVPVRQQAAVLAAAARLGLPVTPADVIGPAAAAAPSVVASGKPGSDGSMLPPMTPPAENPHPPGSRPEAEPSGSDPAVRDAAICRAALALAAARGWQRITLRDVAAAAGLDPAALRARFPSRWHILHRHFALADEAATAGLGPPDPADSIRDRLFDILMRRFDALNRDRAGVLAVAAALRADPLAALATLPAALASMGFLLEAAGASAAGPAGALRAKGLLAVWLAAFRTFAADESEDLAATMAALDQALARAEGPARLLARLDCGGTNGDAATEEAAAPSPGPPPPPDPAADAIGPDE